MALGAMTRVAAKSGDSTRPIYYDRVAFTGEASYVTGGTTGFDALIKALLGDDREVVAIVPEDCGGYAPVYLPDNGGTFKVFREAGAAGPMEEAPATTALDGVTFNLLVLSR